MSTLSNLRQQLSDAKSDLKVYKDRLEDVQDILSDLNNKFNGDIQDINDFITSLIEKSEDGFVDHAHIESIDTQIKADKEKGIGSDSQLSQTKSNLESEIRAVNDKIDSVNRQISSLEQRIAEEEENERREAERRQQEALEKLKKLLKQ